MVKNLICHIVGIFVISMVTLLIFITCMFASFVSHHFSQLCTMSLSKCLLYCKQCGSSVLCRVASHQPPCTLNIQTTTMSEENVDAPTAEEAGEVAETQEDIDAS